VRVRAGVSEFERDALSPGRLDQQHHVRAVHSQSRPVGRLSDPDLCAQRRRRGTAIVFTHHRSVELSGAARGEGGGSFPLWADVQKLCNMCVLSLSWNFFVSHAKYIARPSSRATLIHGQYNRDWGTSYSRPPTDPYLTSPLLQNPGGATGRTHTDIELIHGL